MPIYNNETGFECGFPVLGVSYIGNPQTNTAMYITKKVEHLICELANKENCLVFAEKGIDIPEECSEKNCFVLSDNPRLAYVRYAETIWREYEKRERKRKYTLTEGGYYIGENVTLGEGTYIEPGCVIGHDVVIGKNATIYAGAVVKRAIIGDNFIANENCAVGANGYVLSIDEDGNRVRIPTMGKVIIGNNVEIGALNNISVGTADNTIVEDFVKLDALVYVGHDSKLGYNVEIPAGVTVGGYCVMEAGAFAGFNSTIHNRIRIGKGSMIGMGATVLKSVDAHAVMVGVPARRIGWVCECGHILKETLECPKCGRKYVETENGLLNAPHDTYGKDNITEK